MMNRESEISGACAPCAIYIHFPFCLARCQYCSFVSFPYVVDLVQDYFRAIRSEIELWARCYGAGRSNEPEKIFDSIYIGGGTPSIAPGELWKPVLQLLKSRFHVIRDAEVTIEVNPATFDLSKAEYWRKSGFNRVSLGAQSFNDDELKSMSRVHNSNHIREAVKILKQAGFSNLSIDLLAGYPGQTMDSVLKSVHCVTDCDPCHVSVYLLETKAESAIEKLFSSGQLKPLSDDLSADMYQMVCAELRRNGYEQYEISNFCKPAHESVHNMKYWTDGFFLGIGVGAHGRLEKTRYSNYCEFEKYKNSVLDGKFPWETRLDLDAHTRMVEALLMGLRLNRGVDLIEMSHRCQTDVRRFVLDRLDDLMASGLFKINGNTMLLTDRGRLLSNIVFERFV